MVTVRSRKHWLLAAVLALAVAWVPLAGGPVRAADPTPGSPDTAFNTAVGTTLTGQVRAVAVQSDGKIVVGGVFLLPSKGLARFNADGTADTAFNAAVGANTIVGSVNALTVQPDGKIVVAGGFSSPAKSLARFNADGTADTAFNTAVGTTLDDNAYAVALQPDGKIVVGGYFNAPSRYLARFTSTGTADTAFNTAVGTTLDGGIAQSAVKSVAVQSNGKIVVVGYFSSPSTGLARFNSNGTADSSFNTAAGTTLSYTPQSVAVQSDGKIVVAGNFTSPSKYLARFASDGTADTVFNTAVDGVAKPTAYAMALQSDGAILLGGTATAPTTRLARFDSAGASDTAFDTAVGTSVNGTIYAIALQSNGDILTGGNFTAPSRYLGRYFGTPVKSDQTITFGALADKTFSDSPVAVSATASSGLTVSFSSRTEDVCTVSGTSVTLLTEGTCTVRASQAGNASYKPAPDVDQSFTVTAPKSDQTITFGALADKSLSQSPVSVSATASSGLTVSFATTTPAVCSVSGDSVTLLVAGTCTVRASQAGDASYNPAPDVDQSFTVSKDSQTISFDPLADRTTAQSPVTVSATASSGLPVSFATITPAVCSVSGDSVTLLSPGTCTVRASQAGDAGYNPAPDVDQSFEVLPVPNAPTGVSAVSSGDKAVTVFWAPPLPNGVTVTGYLIQASPGNRACATTSSKSSCTLGSLASGQTYTFTVKANSANGYSSPSTASAPVVAVAVPGAVTGLKAVAGDGQATVRWGVPLVDGGSPITGYEISVGGGSWLPAASPQVVTGLVNGTPASFRVRAINAIGAGRALEVTATPFGVPSAPANLQLTRVSGTKVTVSFDPADGNGRAVSRYTVTASPGANTCSALKPSCTVTGLPPGTYTFTATATNAAGIGPASAPSGSITLP